MRTGQTFSNSISFIEKILAIFVSLKKIIIKIYSAIYPMILIMHCKYKFSFICNRLQLKIFDFLKSENDILCCVGVEGVCLKKQKLSINLSFHLLQVILRCPWLSKTIT